MRVLVLGGSIFLGRSVVDAALAHGHDVAVLNRGRSQPNAAGIDAFLGDRNDPELLARVASAGPWDVIVDTSGYEPEEVALSAASLGPVCRRYVFVSTVTAFEDWPTAPVNESSRLLAFVPAARSYGASKAECERELESALGDRLTVIYPGIMIGPRENVGRLPWWLARHARGGPVIHSLEDSAIAPIDARDVAEFVVRLGEQATRGVVAATRFIVAGARGRTTFGEFLGYCQEVTGGSASPVEVPADILLEHGVEPWTELPLWAPTGHGADAVWATDSSAAVRAGLTFRSLRETIADTWEWMRGIGAATDTARLPAFKAGIGLDATKEQQVIAAAQQKLIGWRDTRTQSGTA